MPLDRYHAKRNFKLTPEPRGRVERRKGKALAFVIQKHAATRLHYDFRLELDGVLKSWAVTKVPSPDTATKRLAVEVEDHQLDYGGFEGTIPKGQYGGGTVQLWDTGTWEPRGDPHEGLAKGNLKFDLNGKRLQGGWALIRMSGRNWQTGKSSKNNWLLIKEKDDFARPGEPDALLAEETSVKSGRTLDQIAANKRGRVWHSNRDDKTKSVEAPRKAAPASVKKDFPQSPPGNGKTVALPKAAKRVPIPEFVEPQLSRLVDEPPSGANWVHEAKFDGYRLQLRVAKGKAVLRTRKALDWSDRFPEIAADGRALADCLIDGEACALDAHGLPNFEALQAALSAGKTGGLVFFVFDILFFDGIDLRQEPLSQRKAVLKQVLDSAKRLPHYRYVEHFATSGKTMLETACQTGLEGIISKRIDAPYRSGRSELWTKAKCRGGQEVVIGGWWGDKDTLRSIQVGAFRDGGFAYMGSVGTGFNSRNVPGLLKALRGLTRATSPFTVGVKPPPAKQINWVEPKLVAEVEFASVTTDGLLRQASFKGLREDKPAKSVVAEKPVAAKTAERLAEEEKDEPMPRKSSTSPAPQRIGAKSGDPSVGGVTISNPGKPLWPAYGGRKEVTKLDLARYYEMAAERILPHITGRPISLVRAPDGINGQRFFQRHVLPGIPAAAMRVKGEAKPFHSTDSVEGLIALAQAGVLEIHPWGCRPNDAETPERLIFDLDPDEDLDFERVMGAAKEMRLRLQKLGFTVFIKTTGGKGLHVVVAIKGTPKKQPTWPEAKEFARLFCEDMVAESPDGYTTNMAKKKRGGKIFLDYLRNDRTSTAVGPWSPRARDGATLSVPITWSQVKTGLNPKEFTIHIAPKLLKRADPWADLMKTAIPLDAARKKLGR